MTQNAMQANVAVLSNVNELVRHITQEIMGTEVSNTLGATPVTRDMIYQLTQSRIRMNFARFNEGANYANT